jgi:tetratricopeptide (TPR) repeat protein
LKKRHPQFNPSDTGVMLIIFAVAFIVRLVYLLQARIYDPQFDYPVIDALFHHQWALQIAGGDIIGSGAFFRAPLYPYFLGLIYAVFSDSIFTAKLIQMLIGALTAALTYKLGTLVFNRAAGIVAGLLMAPFAPAVFYEGELLLDPLAMFLVLAATLTTVNVISKGNRWRWIMAGLLWGLSAACRPTALLMIPVVALYIILNKETGEKSRRWSRLGFVILGCAIVILPITIRNYVVGDDPALIASQAGVNFYIGNNAYADGITATIPELPSWDYRDAVAVAENDLGRQLKPSEISSYYMKKGLDFWIDEPGRAILLTLKKALLFWNAREFPNNRSFYFVREIVPFLKIVPITFGILAPLSLTGLVLAFVYPGIKRKYVYLLAGLIGVHWITHAFFFVNGRFRLPAVPLLACFAGACAVMIYTFYMRKMYKHLAVSVVLIILFAIAVHYNFRGPINDEFAEGWNMVGMTYLDRGNLREAEKAFHTALRRDPRMFMANLNLASIAFYRNDMNSAEQYLLSELKNNPHEIRALNNLSMLYRIQGKYDRSAEYARKAVRSNPAHQEPYINLCMALEYLGRADSARSIVNETLSKYPYFHQLRFYSGELYLVWGDTLSAVDEFEKVVNASDELLVKYADVNEARARRQQYGITLEQLKNEARKRLSEIESAPQ